ncbi:MAG: SDR family oxidoreductase [Bacteroidia bacterium]|nr:SDR family oxidoreductase [Bacteroidia bacterium]
MLKNIVITGATRGIGKAIAEYFASEGFDVAFCARDAKAVEALSFYLSDTFKVKAYGMVADCSNVSDVKSFGAFCISKFEKINVIVNNAGLFIPGSIFDEKEGDFELMMSTNIASAYHLTRSLISALDTEGDGYIFNICSTASFVPYINGGSYCISKHALLGFSKVLRAELASRKTGVSAVMPGATLTDSWSGTKLPATRFMTPENIASFIWIAWQNRKTCVMEEIILRPIQGDI